MTAPAEPLASAARLAKSGFVDVTVAQTFLEELHHEHGLPVEETIRALTSAADPDLAIAAITRIARRDASRLTALSSDADAYAALSRVCGGSSGLAEFLERHPAEVDVLRGEAHLPSRSDIFREIVRDDAVDDVEKAQNRMRTAYRRILTRIANADLASTTPAEILSDVCLALTAAADAVFAEALRIAKADVVRPGFSAVAESDVANTEIAIIAMGKTGAEELNYLSDVDVIYVARPVAGSDISSARAVEVATSLARRTARLISEFGTEPALFEVDANLRPEGKVGALVRTLESHIAYYEKWAENWEFQALLKARGMAGSQQLGTDYVAATQDFVWRSSERDGFVGQVQAMRERVTANIDPEERDRQLKLGPGGLRDVEFTVQLLQLVHGASDDRVRAPATMVALRELAAAGYVGRQDAEQFERDYRTLRVMEHRIQLRRMRRSHVMPEDAEIRRVLARAIPPLRTADELTKSWSDTKRSVRALHEKLFYRPILAAIAGIAGEDRVLLNPDQAAARLQALGFADSQGAIRIIRELTAGVRRKAAIYRALLPVMLSWLSEGAEPDHGLAVLRRLSDALGESDWYLRLLRDGDSACERLMRLLADSRYVGELLEGQPDCIRWLDDDAELRPRTRDELFAAARASIARKPDAKAAKPALLAFRRRELVRISVAALVGLATVTDTGRTLADIADATLEAALGKVSASDEEALPFAIIAMGRYGGRELGFGSDLDVLYVYRGREGRNAETEARRASEIVGLLRDLVDDFRFPMELDAGLRPEGRNGPIVRTIDAYRVYYERWSVSWETQALLRARPAAGDPKLLDDFFTVADRVRYREPLSPRERQEIRSIKARVESERLPQGVDPRRHLKLGRGSLSDVEWLAQLWQLDNAGENTEFRTASTLEALAAAEHAGLASAEDIERLREAWLLSSRFRSGLTLFTTKHSDVIPTDRRVLDGVARILEYPSGSASRLEEDYLHVTRRARQVFDRLFYGIDERSTRR